LYPRHIAFGSAPGLVESQWHVYFKRFRAIVADLGYAVD
jgi:hypothetical protein